MKRITLLFGVSILLTATAAFAQTLPEGVTQAQMDAALSDLSALYGSPVVRVDQAKAICNQEQYLVDCAKIGQEHFASVIQSKETPTDMPELKSSAYDIITVLVEAGFASSKSDARRAIDGGGVRVNDTKVESYDAKVKKGDVVQKGKRFFVRIR